MNSIAIFQRGSPRRRPREHILKSLASIVKSLTSKPTSPRKCPVCGRGQHHFLICKKWAKVMTFFFSSSWRTRQRPRGKFKKTFFLENTCVKTLFPWSLALASSIPVLDLERVGPWPRIVLCPWPRPRALCLGLHLCYYFFNIHLNGSRLGLTSAETNCKEEQISRFFRCVFFYTAKSFQVFLSSWHLLKTTKL